MKKIIILLFSLFLLGNISPLFAIIGTGEGEIVGQTEKVITFRQEGHTIIVDVQINDNPKIYHFLFDTGAQTILNKSVAEELGIEPGMRVPTWDTAVVAHIANVDKIAIGPVTVNQMTVVVFDFLEHAGFYDMDGLIGADFMSLFKMTLDYRNHRLIFSSDTAMIVGDSNSYMMPVTPQPMMGGPLVPCIINDTLKKFGMIDTGSPFGLIFPISLIDSLKASGEITLIESEGEIAKWPMSKTPDNYLCRLEEFDMGGFPLKNVPVIFADIFSILIGEEILAEFLIEFDFPNSILKLTPYPDAVFADYYYSTGARFRKEKDENFKVMGYWKNSPAEKAGMQVGDELLKINDQPADSLSTSALNMFLNNNDIQGYDFLLKRGNDELELHLEKENLLKIDR